MHTPIRNNEFNLQLGEIEENNTRKSIKVQHDKAGISGERSFITGKTLERNKKIYQIR